MADEEKSKNGRKKPTQTSAAQNSMLLQPKNQHAQQQQEEVKDLFFKLISAQESIFSKGLFYKCVLKYMCCFRKPL